MGYFSNGTEGMMYEEKYCSKCKHGKNDNCPIWTMHLCYAYNGSADAKDILDALIPQNKKGCFNEQCRFFEPEQLSLLGAA